MTVVETGFEKLNKWLEENEPKVKGMFFAELEWLWCTEECDHPHVVNEEIVKLLLEAKANFPLFHHNLAVLKDSLEKNEKTLSINNKGAIQIIEWFEKWFGKNE